MAHKPDERGAASGYVPGHAPRVEPGLIDIMK
jgi:hypothetical protein